MNDTTTAKIRAVLAAGPPTGDDIAYCLTLRGYSLTRVARELGITIQTVRSALFDGEKSHNVATFVSAVLGQPLARLWPDGRYNYPPRRARRAAGERRAVA